MSGNDKKITVAQEYKKIRNLHRTIPRGLKRTLFSNYDEMVSKLEEADNAVREVALGKNGTASISLKESVDRAKFAVKENRLIDAVFFAGMVDVILRDVIGVAAPTVNLLKTELYKQYAGSKSPEALQFFRNVKENQGEKKEAQILQGLYKSIFGDPLEKSWEAEIKKFKGPVLEIVNRAETLVSKTLVTFDQMGIARARGNIGSWVGELDNIKRAEDEFNKSLNAAIKAVQPLLQIAQQNEEALINDKTIDSDLYVRMVDKISQPFVSDEKRFPEAEYGTPGGVIEEPVVEETTEPEAEEKVEVPVVEENKPSKKRGPGRPAKKVVETYGLNPSVLVQMMKGKGKSDEEILETASDLNLDVDEIKSILQGEPVGDVEPELVQEKRIERIAPKEEETASDVVEAIGNIDDATQEQLEFIAQVLSAVERGAGEGESIQDGKGNEGYIENGKVVIENAGIEVPVETAPLLLGYMDSNGLLPEAFVQVAPEALSESEVIDFSTAMDWLDDIEPEQLDDVAEALTAIQDNPVENAVIQDNQGNEIGKVEDGKVIVENTDVAIPVDMAPKLLTYMEQAKMLPEKVEEAQVVSSEEPEPEPEPESEVTGDSAKSTLEKFGLNLAILVYKLKESGRSDEEIIEIAKNLNLNIGEIKSIIAGEPVKGAESISGSYSEDDVASDVFDLISDIQFGTRRQINSIAQVLLEINSGKPVSDDKGYIENGKVVIRSTGTTVPLDTVPLLIDYMENKNLLSQAEQQIAKLKPEVKPKVKPEVKPEPVKFEQIESGLSSGKSEPPPAEKKPEVKFEPEIKPAPTPTAKSSKSNNKPIPGNGDGMVIIFSKNANATRRILKKMATVLGIKAKEVSVVDLLDREYSKKNYPNARFFVYGDSPQEDEKEITRDMYKTMSGRLTPATKNEIRQAIGEELLEVKPRGRKPKAEPEPKEEKTIENEIASEIDKEEPIPESVVEPEVQAPKEEEIDSDKPKVIEPGKAVYGDVVATVDQEAVGNFLRISATGTSYKNADKVVVLINARMTGAQLQAAEAALSSLFKKEFLLFIDKDRANAVTSSIMDREESVAASMWDENALKNSIKFSEAIPENTKPSVKPAIQPTASVEQAVIKLAHNRFYKQLKEATKYNDPFLLARMMLKYSEAMEDKDPEVSINLLAKAQEILDV